MLSTIGLLENAENLNDIKNISYLNLHQLKGKRKDQFAIDLGRKLGWRIIVIPVDKKGNKLIEIDLDSLFRTTNIVLVWEVTNHYE